ncbi:MAG TPA: transcriptional regulator [Lactobacillus sp.]|nr:transcriptional regulator [Lactobacillus sp.]
MQNVINSTRKQQKLSQAELAAKTGVTRQTINAIENDKYDPSLDLAFKLADVLGLRVDQLFLWGNRHD